MKVLIGVTSCIHQAASGLNQACRDTWLRDIPEGWKYRFFMGDGTPTGEDESVALATMSTSLCFPKARETVAAQVGQIIPSYTPLPDEFMLSCPDDYFHVPWKTRAMFKWALEHGFDYTFQCCTDTWVDLENLRRSGFEKYDYSGRVCGHEGFGTWARGGPGYWVSKRAMEIIVASPVEAYCEDCSVGLALGKKGIIAYDDTRYSNPYLGETIHPHAVSVHLSDTNIEPEVFTAAKIFKTHRAMTTRACRKCGSQVVRASLNGPRCAGCGTWRRP